MHACSCCNGLLTPHTSSCCINDTACAAFAAHASASAHKRSSSGEKNSDQGADGAGTDGHWCCHRLQLSPPLCLPIAAPEPSTLCSTSLRGVPCRAQQAEKHLASSPTLSLLESRASHRPEGCGAATCPHGRSPPRRHGRGTHSSERLWSAWPESVVECGIVGQAIVRRRSLAAGPVRWRTRKRGQRACGPAGKARPPVKGSAPGACTCPSASLGRPVIGL